MLRISTFPYRLFFPAACNHPLGKETHHPCSKGQLRLWVPGGARDSLPWAGQGPAGGPEMGSPADSAPAESTGSQQGPLGTPSSPASGS